MAQASMLGDVCKELWEYLLKSKPEFSISKGIIPKIPALDRYSLETYKHREVSTETCRRFVHSVFHMLGFTTQCKSYQWTMSGIIIFVFKI